MENPQNRNPIRIHVKLLGSILISLGTVSISHAGISQAEIIHVDWTERGFSHTSSIAPTKILEVCDRSKQGEAITWQFKGSAATDFNIHYHVGKQVSYPKKGKGVMADSGKLAIPADRSYCWMWTNKGKAPVNLSVKLSKAR